MSCISSKQELMIAFWKESAKFQRFKSNLIQLHQDNCHGCIGNQVTFKTKGRMETAKIVSIAKGSIYIENQENKSESTHKKSLVIPKIVNGKRVSKAGRNVYMFI